LLRAIHGVQTSTAWAWKVEVASTRSPWEIPARRTGPTAAVVAMRRIPEIFKGIDWP
jgi:hypothetical protein